MNKIDEEALMSILYNDLAGRAYLPYTTTTVSKDRFVPTRSIKIALLKQGIKCDYATVRREYDRLCDKGLCDRMKRRNYVNYAPRELQGHMAIGDKFVTGNPI